MKGMVLAAGLGTRLRPLTNETPKGLIPVGGRPLIHYSLLWLKAQGIENIVINLHHLGGQISDALGDGSALGLNLTYSKEPEILGTGGGIKKLAGFFGTTPFCVINADVIIDVSLRDAIALHHEHHALATLVLRPHPKRHDKAAPMTGLFRDDTGRIYKSCAADQIGDEILPGAEMFTGVQIIEPELIQRLPDGPSCIFQDGYRPAIEAGDAIYGFNYEGYWQDLGTPEQYQQADQELTSGKIRLSYT